MTIDIEKERKAFEDWFDKECPTDAVAVKMHEEDAIDYLNAMMPIRYKRYAWGAWQARAEKDVPETNFGNTAYVDELSKVITDGMTLRDYFASKALPAVYAEFWRGVASGDYGVGGDDWPTGVAMDAYRMADSMLKAR